MLIVIKKTGHMSYGRPDCDDGSCGTCDGGRCEDCNTLYSAYGYEDYSFSSREEAEVYGKKQEALRSALIPNIPMEDLHDPLFFLRKKELWVHLYRSHGLSFEESGCIEVKCNPEAPSYVETWEKAVDLHDRYAKCPCPEKGQNAYISGCEMFDSCDDLHCHIRMQAGSRSKPLYG